MSASTPLLLIGIGTGGCSVARGVYDAFGEGLRYLLADTDARTGDGGGPFTLFGGDRLSGRGAGGNVVNARIAAEESIQVVDESLEGVRLAVIVTTLGGGTGGGATIEVLKHLASVGVPTVVFATTPFAFEGEDRQRNARGVMPMIEESANATFFLPLDKLVGDTDNMAEALRNAIAMLTSAITLFWRLVEKPGYLQLDVERIRHLLTHAGRGRFACATVQGENRAAQAVELLAHAPLLTAGSSQVRAILCGVLAGEDLRLSEVGTIATGLRTAFGERCSFELATVNDEETFSGRISVVALLFEADKVNEADATGTPQKSTRHKRTSVLTAAPTGRGRFNNSEPTIWHGEDLDVPTFIRKNISLDF